MNTSTFASARTFASVTLLVVMVGCSADQPVGEDFDAFWTSFRAAIEQNSEAEVRALTRFPFMYESKERSSAEFGEVYRALFDESARRCIEQATPVPDGESYQVFCGAIIYVFAQTESDWQFAEFAADPEAVMETGA